MDMESYGYLNHLGDLVKEGKVSVDKIDDSVRRILRVKFLLGLFDDPYKFCDETREKETTGKQEFQDVVLDMAKKSIVLLKNENDLLPLKKSGQKIAIIGALANDKTSPLGSWRIGADDNTAVSLRIRGQWPRKPARPSPVSRLPGSPMTAMASPYSMSSRAS